MLKGKDCIILFGLVCVWVVFACYYALKLQPTEQNPLVGPRILHVTADCRWRHFGNAMFNYASLLGIAHRNARIPVLPYDLSIRNMLRCPMRKGGFEFNFGMYLNYNEGGWRSGSYDSGTEHLPNFNMKLNGFYQSWKYFRNVEDELRSEHFVLLPEVEIRVKDYMHANIPTKYKHSKDLTFVGVHVRRGDMMQKHLLLKGYVAVTKDYLDRAMNYFRKKFSKVIFFLCTDSPEWTKENISGDDVVNCDGRNAMIDFGILSKCNHSILSVGSFGWWSAWLANGTTIYFKDWPRPASVLAYEVNKEDYFPPHWIPM